MKLLTLLHDFQSGYTPLSCSTDSTGTTDLIGCGTYDLSASSSSSGAGLWPVIGSKMAADLNRHRTIIRLFLDDVLKLPEDDGLRMHVAVVKYRDNSYDFSNYYNVNTFVIVVTDELYTAINLYLTTVLTCSDMTMTEYLALVGFKPGMERMPSAVQLQATARAYAEMSEFIWTYVDGNL